MIEGIKYNNDDNESVSIMDPKSKYWKTSVAGFEGEEVNKETIYFNDDSFEFTDKALNGKVKSDSQIKYMKNDDKVDYSNSDDLIVNLKDDLKNNNNRIYLSNSFYDVVSKESTENVKYNDMILTLNNGVYKNYVSTPNYDKMVYDYIEKLKSKNINVPIDKVVYYENKDGVERVYLNNGYVICLDKNENINAYDYVYNTKYLFKKGKDNSYDLTSIKVCNKDNEVLEINYDGNKTTVKDLLKEDKDKQKIYSISNRDGLDYISLKNGDICFSDGYTLEKTKDGYKGVDRISIMNDVACAQVGNTHEKYSNWYNNGNGPVIDHWCAKYVSWLFYNNVGEGYINKGPGAGHSLLYGMKGTWIDINNASDNGSYPNQIVYVDSVKSDKERSVITDKVIDSNVTDKSKLLPREGDLIFFNPVDDYNNYVPFPKNQSMTGEDRYCSGHVGYVYKVENGKVYTVEGNTGGDSPEYTLVSYRSYDIDDYRINGYFRPEY